MTLLADPAGSHVLECLALHPVFTPSKRLSCRTGVGVGLGIIDKQTFRKNPPAPLLLVLGLFEYRDVSEYPTVVAF